MDDSVLINGPETAALTLLFAHGAGASMGSSFMEDIALGLSERGWRTVRFNFPYMIKRLKTGRQCPPDRQERLIECFEQHVNQVLSESSPLLLAGKSWVGAWPVSWLIASTPVASSRAVSLLGIRSTRSAKVTG